MILIVCTDARGGIRFNRRRQSRDRAVAADILACAAGRPLWMHPSSAALFADAPNIRTAENAPLCAGADELCFWEDALPPVCAARVTGLIRYNWNRIYPADVYWNLDPAAAGLTLLRRAEFAGSSHAKITREEFGYGTET